MILLGMMGLVENKQIDLIHSHIRIEQALVQYLCCAHYHHVRFEVLIPGLLAPQICSHGTEELRDILVEIVAQDSPLLVYEGDAIYLDGSQLPLFFFLCHYTLHTRKNDIRCGFPFARSFNSF